MKHHIKNQIDSLQRIYETFDDKSSKSLLQDCLSAIKKGNSIIAGGLGKNVPICEKFVGTLNSLGIKAHFLHISSAIHGDLGLVSRGDVVILLSKSGETSETIYLSRHLVKKSKNVWVLTSNKKNTLSKIVPNSIFLDIQHEGDPWNLVPNHSSVVFLVYLQALAMAILEGLPVKLATFKGNHPGGSIGKTLRSKNFKA
jgi:D-arabinose 5-phosphate isomerase GutQ